MKVCVFGLWHLGTVTAACLAEAGHDVVGLDPDDPVISDLNRGQPPIYEPGLESLLHTVMERGHILFTTDVEDALCDAEVVWVTFDTPVDEDDNAHTGYVLNHIESIFPYLQSGTVVLISSQLPVGTTRQLEEAYIDCGCGEQVTFAAAPENLRLGTAIEAFKHPDRVVVGVRDAHSKAVVAGLLASITQNIQWMGVESAEMTKHALNSFLATSVTFANEVGTLCEQVGADAKEVERGLKSDTRIGPKAYLAPGAAFSGGTLARDVAFLGKLAERYEISLPMIESVPESNDMHKLWAVRRVQEIVGDVRGKTITILGLTYKPNTDTLRRSLAVEIARQLHSMGAVVQAHDPNIKQQPQALGGVVAIKGTPGDAIQGADVVILGHQWIGYQELEPALFTGKIMLDANGFLRESLEGGHNIHYYSVGNS